MERGLAMAVDWRLARHCCAQPCTQPYQARCCDQCDGKECDGTGDELHVAMAQVLKQQLRRDEGQYYVSQMRKFDASPARSTECHSQCGQADRKGAQESYVVPLDGDKSCRSSQSAMHQQSNPRKYGDKGGKELKCLLQCSVSLAVSDNKDDGRAHRDDHCSCRQFLG